MYDAGTINIKGTRFDIRTDDKGQWHAWLNAQQITASSRAELERELKRRIRENSIAVAIPFAARSGDYHRIGQVPAVRTGTATGLHSSNNNVLVTWTSGEKEQYTMYGSVELRGDADTEVWRGLLRAKAAAEKALNDFEAEHKINLKSEVAAAIRQAADTTVPAGASLDDAVAGAMEATAGD